MSMRKRRVATPTGSASYVRMAYVSMRKRSRVDCHGWLIARLCPGQRAQAGLADLARPHRDGPHHGQDARQGTRRPQAVLTCLRHARVSTEPSRLRRVYVWLSCARVSAEPLRSLCTARGCRCAARDDQASSGPWPVAVLTRWRAFAVPTSAPRVAQSHPRQRRAIAFTV